MEMVITKDLLETAKMNKLLNGIAFADKILEADYEKRHLIKTLIICGDKISEIWRRDGKRFRRDVCDWEHKGLKQLNFELNNAEYEEIQSDFEDDDDEEY